MAGELNLEEINRVRASLGLPLLPTGNNPQPAANSNANLNFKATDSADPEDDPGSTLESRQGEAGSNWDKWQSDQLEKKRRETQREKLRKERERAQRNLKLEGKGLADDDDDEDARAWLVGSNKRQKKIAKTRDRMLQRELAERERENLAYTEKDLAGLRVGHEYGEFDNTEGGDQILTLADADVNDSENEDTLENIDLRDQERVKQRQEIKLRKPAYDPNVIEENGERSILGQYDEEIDGKKKQKRFTLDEMGAANGNKSKTEDGSRQRFSLDFHQDDTPISDYQEAKEIKIKKPKKSKKDKSKKKRSADDDGDLFPGDQQEEGGETMQVDEGNVTSSNGNKRSYDDTFGDDDLQANLAAQRRATLKKQKRSKVEDFVRTLREEGSATPMETNEDNEDEDEGAFILDETSEFVNNMGKERSESPEPVRRRRVKEESLGVKMEDADSPMDEEMAERNGYRDTPDSDIKREDSNTPGPERQNLTSTGLDAEDRIDQGLGSTLKMLTQRGLYQRESDNANARDRERNRFLHEKMMREKRAEDAARAQRERDRQSTQYKQMSNREREAAAQQANAVRDQRDSRFMAEAFNREYKPNVDIKYIDEFGRRMDQKEAFKHLSHQFHGKGSGKGKSDKRIQKITQEHSREGKSSLQSDADGFEGTISKQRGAAGVRLQ